MRRRSSTSVAAVLRRWWVHGPGPAVSLLMPALFLLLVAFIGPLGTLLRFSFDRFIPGGRLEEAFILDNYARFVIDPYNRGVLVRTLLLGAGVTLLTLVLAYPLAFVVARSNARWRGVLVAVTLVPLMISVVVRSYGWTILLANSGIINKGLIALGFGQVRLLFSMTGVVLSLTQVLMPFMVLTLSAVLQSISPDLVDAARGLGASRWSVFRTVLLPLSLPGIAAGSFLVFALSISAFATPRLVGGAGVEVMATMIYDQALNSLNWPFAAACSFALMLIVLGLTVLQGSLLRLRSQA